MIKNAWLGQPAQYLFLNFIYLVASALTSVLKKPIESAVIGMIQFYILIRLFFLCK